ncbi:histone H2B type F-M-like isoform X1 [Pongo pygmaeus]|nr:histone H2B type F-M-like [Pongo pygmaeus]
MKCHAGSLSANLPALKVTGWSRCVASRQPITVGVCGPKRPLWPSSEKPFNFHTLAKLHDIGLGNDFLDMTLKAQQQKQKGHATIPKCPRLPWSPTVTLCSCHLMAAASTMAEASSETTSGENQSIQEPKEANSTTVQKQKRRGRRGSRRRHANCRGDSFAPYFPRVLKQVHQGLSLSQEAVSVMDSMVHDILDRIATEAGQLARYTKRVTITSRDIQMAVRLLLPGKMGKLAEAQGTNAALRTSLCAIWQQRK